MPGAADRALPGPLLLAESGPLAVLLNTPQYTAPEIPLGGAVGPPADLYALGVVLYELSCGVPPFAGRGAADLAHLVPTRPGGVPDRLWAVIAALLDKDPARRPHAAATAELLDATAPGLAGWPAVPRLPEPPPPVDPRRARRTKFAGVLVAVAAVGLWSPGPSGPALGVPATPPPPAPALSQGWRREPPPSPARRSAAARGR
ncbi:hypothetical protein ACFQV2_32050 [Actinokineospora soli]|uniref:non-specific serine/threonine protein kinase n=1 Tax=Actinokineospora soli TaxID=1048753 RepID=A0ABW2TVQ0_9PSEU